MGGRSDNPSIAVHVDGGFRIDSTSLRTARIIMNGNRYYGVRVEGAKYSVGFGSALAVAISYTNNHSILGRSSMASLLLA